MLSLDLRKSLEWRAAHPGETEKLLEMGRKRGGAVDPSEPYAAMGARRQLEARDDHCAISRTGAMSNGSSISFSGWNSANRSASRRWNVAMRSVPTTGLPSYRNLGAISRLRHVAAGAHLFLLYTYRLKLAGGFSFPLMVEHVKALSGIDPPLHMST